MKRESYSKIKPEIKNEIKKGEIIGYISTLDKEYEKCINYKKGYGAIRLDISKRISIVLNIEDLKKILD